MHPMLLSTKHNIKLEKGSPEHDMEVIIPHTRKLRNWVSDHGWLSWRTLETWPSVD